MNINAENVQAIGVKCQVLRSFSQVNYEVVIIKQYFESKCIVIIEKQFSYGQSSKLNSLTFP
jgi:hypothetical protein